MAHSSCALLRKRKSSVMFLTTNPTSSDSPAVRLWDAATGRPRGSLLARAWPSHCVAFSPDGRTLAAGYGDGSLRLWDLVALRESAVVREHEGRVVSVAFAPDGRTLASAGQGDGTIKLWDLAHLTGP